MGYTAQGKADTAEKHASREVENGQTREFLPRKLSPRTPQLAQGFCVSGVSSEYSPSRMWCTLASAVPTSMVRWFLSCQQLAPGSCKENSPSVSHQLKTKEPIHRSARKLYSERQHKGNKLANSSNKRKQGFYAVVECVPTKLSHYVSRTVDDLRKDKNLSEYV